MCEEHVNEHLCAEFDYLCEVQQNTKLVPRVYCLDYFGNNYFYIMERIHGVKSYINNYLLSSLP